jgi:hypothetical protein
MLILLYILIGSLLVSSVLLNLNSEEKPQILRSAFSLAIIAVVIYLIKDIFIEFVVFLGEYNDIKILPRLFEFSLYVFGYFILSLTHYFKGVLGETFKSRTDFISILVLIIGAASLILNKYDLLFYSLIGFGFMLLLTKFIIKNSAVRNSIWLTLLYSLPVIFLSVFLITQAEMVTIVSKYFLVDVKVLSISIEYVLVALIASLLLLVVYYLPYERLTSRFPKIRIQ